jgi:hypothetical protein
MRRNRVADDDRRQDHRRPRCGLVVIDHVAPPERLRTDTTNECHRTPFMTLAGSFKISSSDADQEIVAGIDAVLRRLAEQRMSDRRHAQAVWALRSIGADDGAPLASLDLDIDGHSARTNDVAAMATEVAQARLVVSCHPDLPSEVATIVRRGDLRSTPATLPG